jgi:hypothetical protein
MTYSEEHILNNIDSIPLEFIVRSQKLSLSTLYKLSDSVELNVILQCQKLDMNFIKTVILNKDNIITRREEEINIDDICLYQDLDDDQKRELIEYRKN